MPSSWPASISASTASAEVSGCSLDALLGERSDRLQKTQHDRDRQHEVDQNLQNQRPVHQPLALGAREEHERQKAVADDDDQDQADRGLQDFVDAPGLIAENQEADHQRDRRHGELREHRHGKRGPGAAHAQLGFDLLLEDVDVVLEFARKKFADFLIDAIDVGDQREQTQQKQKRNR